MASGAFAVVSSRIAASFVLVAVLLPLGAVIWRAGGLTGLGPAERDAVIFTVHQALWSAGLSVLFAVPVARALARRTFPLRGALITLLGAPFILPVIVAILGLLAVFGQAGLLGTLAQWAGLEAPRIYGFSGVVLAHVFFNLPLAVRLILQGWLSIPAERFRLAGALNLSPGAIRRHIEWPMLRDVVPGIFLVIFLICATSFAVALTLGGGPRATTVELAIYQAFRFDADPGKAATLALVQVALTGTAALLSTRLRVPLVAGAGLDRPLARWDATGLWARAGDIAVVSLAATFLLLPLGSVVLRGLMSLGELPDAVWAAAVRSLWVAGVSAALAVALALALALGAARKARAGFDLLGTLTLAASPLVLGTGLYILLLPVTDPVRWALPVTAGVNALMSLPFAFRALLPAVQGAEREYGRLADSLGLHGWSRLRWVLMPRLRRPLGFAAGLSAALSMGDLGVIALFSDPNFATLPLTVFRLMAAYRMDAAAAAALVLLALTLGVFWALDRGGRVSDPV